jgi:hypothetical protein
MMETYEADVTDAFGAVEEALRVHAGVYPPGLQDALARLLSAGSSTMETEGVEEEVDT